MGDDNWQIVEVWCNLFECKECFCWRMELCSRKEQTIDWEPAHPLFFCSKTFVWAMFSSMIDSTLFMWPRLSLVFVEYEYPVENLSALNRSFDAESRWTNDHLWSSGRTWTNSDFSEDRKQWRTQKFSKGWARLFKIWKSERSVKFLNPLPPIVYPSGHKQVQKIK